MTILAVGSSTFSCATTIVTTPAPLGLYLAWKIPIDGVYDAAAIAVTASANAAAHPKTVKRMDLFMAPFLRCVASVLLLRRKFGRTVVSRNTTLRRQPRTIARWTRGRSASSTQARADSR